MKFISVPDDDPRAEYELLYERKVPIDSPGIFAIMAIPKPKEKTNAEIVDKLLGGMVNIETASGSDCLCFRLNHVLVRMLDIVDQRDAKLKAELKGDG